MKLPPELAHSKLEVGPFDLDLEVADTEVKQLIVGERLPRDLGLPAGQGSLLAPDRAIPADRRC
jgi:hypothetical protein